MPFVWFSDNKTHDKSAKAPSNNNNNYNAVLAKRRQVRATQVNSLQTGLF